jgi:hypothetical protein
MFQANQGQFIMYGDGASGTINPQNAGSSATCTSASFVCSDFLQHTYNTPGTYTAELIDDNGNVIGRIVITVGANNGSTFLGQ